MQLKRRDSLLGTDAKQAASEAESAVDSEAIPAQLLQDRCENRKFENDTRNAECANSGNEESKTTLQQHPPSLKEALNNALSSGLKGGIAGAAAMGVNVISLMWIRTTVSE